MLMLTEVVLLVFLFMWVVDVHEHGLTIVRFFILLLASLRDSLCTSLKWKGMVWPSMIRYASTPNSFGMSASVMGHDMVYCLPHFCPTTEWRMVERNVDKLESTSRFTSQTKTSHRWRVD
mmetsp:Transcript_3452/g.9155  ORF Transcript_3452/g.9155 Transcript_3452/m.9155 type:complete len:120 (-) Transcript_3452:494-853(-)